MTILPLMMTKAAKALFQSLRKTTYDDMAHQASDWIPEEARIDHLFAKSSPSSLILQCLRRIAWPGFAGPFSTCLNK